MDIIERAARELYKTEYSGPFGGDEDQYWDIHVEAVKTVLTAIREPSTAMIGAASEVTGILHDDVVENEMKAIWQAMIDAALIEGQ